MYLPHIFFRLVAFSTNIRNEKTAIMSTIEEHPKFFILNLHNYTFSILGRKTAE